MQSDIAAFRCRVAALAGAFALAAPLSAEARIVRDHRDPSQGGGAYPMMVTPVVDFELSFPAGRRITCETSNITGNADPVLHVLEKRNGPPVELGFDDDSAGNLNARATFSAPAAGVVRIIMRSSGFGAGTADLRCEGYQPMRGLIVGGAFKTIRSWRDRDSLLSVPLPGGPTAYRLYTIDFSTGRLLGRFPSDASQTAIATGRPPGEFVAMLGSSPGTIPIVKAIGPAIDPDDIGPVLTRPAAAVPPVRGPGADRADPGPRADPSLRLPDDVRPDIGDRATEVEIVFSPDPPGLIRLIRNDLYIAGHDPDGDGLGTELESHIGTCSQPNQVIGNWECSRSFDVRDTDGDGLTDRIELMGKPEKAPPQLLPRWGADPLHKDLFIEVDFMQRAQGEARRTMTPVMAKAMAANFADPETNAVLRLLHAQSLNNPDLKAGIAVHLDIGVIAPDLAETTYGAWGGHNLVPAVCDANGCRGDDAGAVWQTQMHQNRRGVFHYALGYPGGGGQAPYHSFALNMPLDDSMGAAHELGHTLGLTHGGPEGLGADANCKPNYPSLMSYAYSNRFGFRGGFSDGYGRSALNNVLLKERGAVAQPSSAQGAAYLGHLRDIFKYNVVPAAGDVDWDRDGVISDAPVRAYANNDHTLCEYTRVNQMNAAGLADGAVALTRHSGRTMLFYIDETDRRLNIEFTDDALNCPTIGTGCGPALQRRTPAEAWNGGILAVDAHPIGSASQRRILVVFRTSAGLFETTMTKTFNFTPPVAIPTASPAIDELSLAGGSGETFLAFKSAANEVVLKRRGGAAVWGADEPALGAGGAPLGVLGEGSSPAILHATYRDGRRVLFGLFPLGSTGVLRLFERDAASGRWTQSPWQMSPESSIGRPALAFEPVAAASPLPGRLRLIHMRRSTDRAIVRSAALEASAIGAGAQARMVFEDHDNVWYYGKGVDLLFEAGVDTNLRAAVVSALIENGTPSPHRVQLRPKADGIVNFTYKNWDDWEALGIDLCRMRVKGGAQVNCRDWPYNPGMQPPPVDNPAPPVTPPSGGASTPPPRPNSACLRECSDLADSCLAEDQSAFICRRLAVACRAACPAQ